MSLVEVVALPPPVINVYDCECNADRLLPGYAGLSFVLD
jgi:hypothetical protein